jgi:hypothetical protein
VRRWRLAVAAVALGVVAALPRAGWAAAGVRADGASPPGRPIADGLVTVADTRLAAPVGHQQAGTASAWFAVLRLDADADLDLAYRSLVAQAIRLGYAVQPGPWTTTDGRGAGSTRLVGLAPGGVLRTLDLGASPAAGDSPAYLQIVMTSRPAGSR